MLCCVEDSVFWKLPLIGLGRNIWLKHTLDEEAYSKTQSCLKSRKVALSCSNLPYVMQSYLRSRKVILTKVAQTCLSSVKLPQVMQSRLKLRKVALSRAKLQ